MLTLGLLLITLSGAVGLVACSDGHDGFFHSASIRPADLGAGWRQEPVQCDDVCDRDSFHGCDTDEFYTVSYLNSLIGESEPSGFDLRLGILGTEPETCIAQAVDAQYQEALVSEIDLACPNRVVTFPEDAGRATRLVILFASAERSAASLNILFENVTFFEPAAVQAIGELACNSLRRAEAA